jgi:hypothetical protein
MLTNSSSSLTEEDSKNFTILFTLKTFFGVFNRTPPCFTGYYIILQPVKFPNIKRTGPVGIPGPVLRGIRKSMKKMIGYIIGFPGFVFMNTPQQLWLVVPCNLLMMFSGGVLVTLRTTPFKNLKNYSFRAFPGLKLYPEGNLTFTSPIRRPDFDCSACQLRSFTEFEAKSEIWDFQSGKDG